MIDIKVIEKKLKIGGKEYTFRLDFDALMKFEEKYEDAIDLFNTFLGNRKIYGTVVKILSCACKEKEWTEEELKKALGFSLPVMKMVDEVTFALVMGTLQEVKDEGTTKKDSGKKQ